jgi:hypothetical protein
MVKPLSVTSKVWYLWDSTIGGAIGPKIKDILLTSPSFLSKNITPYLFFEIILLSISFKFKPSFY